MTETNLIKQKIKEQWNSLGETDKRVLRFYIQLSEEDLLKKAQQYVQMAEDEKNDKRQESFLHQVQLYKIAYLLKFHQIPVKGGKQKTRRRQVLKRRKRTQKR